MAMSALSDHVLSEHNFLTLMQGSVVTTHTVHPPSGLVVRLTTLDGEG